MDRARAIAKLTAPGRKYELQNVCVNGNEVKWFVNAPTSLRQLISEARCEKTFFVYNDERYTFEEFYQRASNLGRRLIDDYGVKPGDRVAIGLRNYPEWALAFAAITSIGGIVAGLNAWWESDELEYGIRHIGAKVAIVDQERLDRVKLQSGLDFLTLISVRSEPCDRATPIDQLLRQHGELPDIQIEPDDDAVILFTSGSTGHPKGSVSTHRNIIAALLSWELDLAVLATIHGGAPKGQSKPHYPDAALLGMPLFHVNGLLAVLLTSFRRKRKTVAMYKWDPNVAVELVEAEKIVSFVGTPAMTGDLMLAAQKQDKDVSSLLAVGGGGSARAESQVKGIDETFKNAKPHTGWGMTETNSIGTSIGGEEYLMRPSSSGRVSAVLELGIVDSDDNFVKAGERGELLVRGTSVIHKYWDRPDSSGDFLEGGWFRTGDIAYLDEDGYLYIVDRLKQIIIRGGENIGCAEVESAMLNDPAIIEVSVYGVADQRLGEDVAATIYVDREVDVDAIRSNLKLKIAGFKIPKHIRVTTEPLVRIASGKIDKKTIQKDHQKLLDLE